MIHASPGHGKRCTMNEYLGDVQGDFEAIDGLYNPEVPIEEEPDGLG